VVRSGSTFTGYRSPDGVNWTSQGTATITMASTVYVGLAVDSYNCWDLETAAFDNVTAPGWANYTTPAAPAGPAATGGNGQAALSWQAVTNAASYNVKRAATAGGPYTNIANVTTTNFTDSGLTGGTTYYYVVSALNPAGESANSVPAGATTLSQPRVVGSSLVGGSLVCSGTNGSVGGAYTLWSSTNLAAPLTNWVQVGSGNFDGQGNFSITNALNPNQPQQFYRLRQP
jgi:hypothetical protein